MTGQHDNNPVQTIIYKPNEHADEYIVAIDDVAEVSPSARLPKPSLVKGISMGWDEADSVVGAMEVRQEHRSIPIRRTIRYRKSPLPSPLLKNRIRSCDRPFTIYTMPNIKLRALLTFR